MNPPILLQRPQLSVHPVQFTKNHYIGLIEPDLEPDTPITGLNQQILTSITVSQDTNLTDTDIETRKWTETVNIGA